MRANSFNTGIASEYLILSMLYRKEIEAYVSQGNKKSVDIRVITPSGRPISVDVKSVRGYSSVPVNNVVQEEDHILVFVIYKNKFRDLSASPDIYIVPSLELKWEEWKEQKRVMIGNIKEYQDRWYYLTEEGDNGMHTKAELDELDEKEELRIHAEWKEVKDLRSKGFDDEMIADELDISLKDVEQRMIDYHELTGN